MVYYGLLRFTTVYYVHPPLRSTTFMTVRCDHGFRAIQPNLSFDMWFMSPKRSFMPKKKKSYWSVSEIDPPPSILTDGQTDGRRANQYWKSSAAFRLAELKTCKSYKPWSPALCSYYVVHEIIQIHMICDMTILEYASAKHCTINYIVQL